MKRRPKRSKKKSFFKSLKPTLGALIFWGVIVLAAYVVLRG